MRKKWISIVLVLSFLISIVPFSAQADSIDSAMQILTQYYQDKTTLSSSYWDVFAARSVLEDTFDSGNYQLYDITAHKQEEAWQATDYAAVILQLIMTGANPYDDHGRNYVQELIEYNKINGFWGIYANPIWAGIALEAAGADGYSRDSYIKYAKAQLSALTTGADIAGWSLILLSEHMEYDGVGQEIERFKTKIKQSQIKEGQNIGYFDTGSLAGGSIAMSTACVISGLTALGVDVLSDEWCVDGISAVDTLFKNEINEKKFINTQIAAAVADVQYGNSIFKRIRITKDDFTTLLTAAEAVDTALYTQESKAVFIETLAAAKSVLQDSDKMSRNAFGKEYFALRDSMKQLQKQGEITISVYGDDSVLLKDISYPYSSKNINEILADILTQHNIAFTVQDGQLQSIGGLENTEETSFRTFVNGMQDTESIKDGDDIVFKYCDAGISALSEILAADDVKLIDLKMELEDTKGIIRLPAYGVFGSVIEWKSSNEDVISTDGMIVRKGTDKEITLTAEVSNGNRKVTQSFVILVPKRVSTSGGSGSGTESAQITVSFKLVGDTVHETEAKHDSFSVWISKTKYKVEEGTTVYEVFKQALKENDMEFAEGTKGYISKIKAPKGEGGYWLGEFDNGKDSGWIYTINGVRVTQSIIQQELSDGDEIIFQYTDNYHEEDTVSSRRPGKTPKPTASPTATPAGSPQPTVSPTPKPSIAPVMIEFTDISSCWAEPYIVSLVKKGYLKGKTDTQFKPFDFITRAEIAGILSRINTFEPTKKNPFLDISTNDWYYDSVLWAAETGIVQGDSGLFRPDEMITRQDLASMLYRYLQYENVKLTTGTGTVFADSADIAEYAVPAVNAMSRAGIISGRENGTFEPLAYATRAETAKMIDMVINL